MSIGRICAAALLCFLAATTLGFTSGSRESGAASGQSGTGVAEEGSGEPSAEKLSVFVSIQPQRYFVERVAGDRAEVTVLVPPDRGPETYEPTPRQIEALGRAQLYFRIGVPFERAFIPRIEAALPNLRIVDTSRNIRRRALEEHSHEDEHELEHEGRSSGRDEADGEPARTGDRGSDGEPGNPDPHIWMSPPLVKKQAETIRDALVDLRPELAQELRENYRRFARDIDRLHAALSELLAPVAGETLFAFHPSFGYFAEAYGLEQEAIETGGDQPSAARLERLIANARAEGVRVIFVQPQFSKSAAERVAQAIDGAVVTVNPLAPDWLENMRGIAEAVREGLE